MKKFYSILSCILLLAASACGDSDSNEDPIEVKAPELSAPVVSDVSSAGFTVHCDVKTNGNAISSAGFCYVSYSLTSAPPADEPTVTDYKVTGSVSSDGDLTANFTRLVDGFAYIVRGYVNYGGNVAYSTSTTVRIGEVSTGEGTPAEVARYQGPGYVDDYRNIASWDKRSQWNLSNVHDPTVMLADDGYYYMYQTDASFGNAHDGHGHFHGRRSKDLVNWEYLGATMTSAPKWVNEKVNEYRRILGLPDVTIKEADQGFWAPCARNIGGGKYRMYYSVVNDATLIEDGAWPERSFIGVMETSDPASNKWEDKGFVICAASDRGTNWKRPSSSYWNAYNRWNAIDPTFIITPEGEHWLIYGSWHSGFAAVQLDPATGKTLNDLPNPWGTSVDIAPYGKMVNTRKMGDRWQGSEGPEVVYHDGYYYMFMAYDGLDVPYNTRVVRSTKVNGPYTDMYGTDVSNTGGDAYPIVTHPYKFGNDHGWVGISHCAVWSDNAGNWYYASQARYPTDYDSWAPNAIMLGHVRAIRWTRDGWPLVMPERYGAVPQVPITESEIAGSWSHLTITYQYGKQIASTEITLNEDHTVAGSPWTNMKWRFDFANQSIVISNSSADIAELYLMRECNWEGSRLATIVYAAYGDHRTYWGKKN